MTRSLHQRQYRQIIARLVAERERLGISQIQMAIRLELSQSAISKIERLERRLDISEFIQWCDALGVRAAKIVAEFDSFRSRRRAR